MNITKEFINSIEELPEKDIKKIIDKISKDFRVLITNYKKLKIDNYYLKAKHEINSKYGKNWFDLLKSKIKKI